MNYSQSLVPLLFLQHNILKYAKLWIEIWCWTAGPKCSLSPQCGGVERGKAKRFTVDRTECARNDAKVFLHHHFIHSLTESMFFRSLLCSMREGRWRWEVVGNERAGSKV